MSEDTETAPWPAADGRPGFEEAPACSPASLWCAARTRWLGDDGCVLCREEADG